MQNVANIMGTRRLIHTKNIAIWAIESFDGWINNNFCDQNYICDNGTIENKYFPLECSTSNNRYG